VTSTAVSTTGIAIYIACASEDEAMRKKLEILLNDLTRRYQITWWHKYLVDAGHERRREIESHLQRADIVLLLISPDFLKSDECFNVEMLSALKRHDTEETRVIPIVVRPTPHWEEQPFGKLQMLPRNTEPITAWPNRDQAYKEIAEEVGNIIKALQPEHAAQRGSIGTRPLLPALPPLVQRRSKLVKHVYTHLSQDISALMLTAIGGGGKTILSKLVYYYAKKQFEVGKGPFNAEPIWLEIQPSFTMADLTVRMFQALGKPPSDFSSLLPQEQAEMLLQALDSADAVRLVILDQFEHFLDTPIQQTSSELSGARIWLDLLNNSRLRGSRVLLTSRLRPNIAGYPHGRIEIFPVPDLDIAEGVAFLRASLHSSGIKSSDPELQTVVERCKGHPLSLVLLASLLKDNKSLNLSVLLNNPHYGLELENRVADAMLDVIYQKQLDQAQRHLLCAFSVFREPAPLEAAGYIMGLSTSTEARPLLRQLLSALNGLRHRHLLQDAGSLCYQLHPIVTSYALDHFAERNEQANHLALLEAHVKAAEYYQQQAKNSCPPGKQRTSLLDFHDFVEGVWHWCKAKRQETAYQLIREEGLFVDIQRCGGNTILFELYRMLLPSENWQPEPLQSAQLYNEFGEIQRTLGQKREAYHHLTKALSLFQELQDLEGQVKTLNNLGAVCKDLGQLEQALAYYQNSLQICDTMEIPNIHGKATVLNNLGVISIDLGQKEQALKYFEQALLMQQMLEDHGEAACTLMNIGKVYDLQKRNEEAYLKYAEALKIFQMIGDRGRLATLYNHLGQFIRTRSGREKPERKQEAWEYHTKALHIFREIGDRWEEATTLQHLGRLSFVQALGKDSRIKESFKESLALYLYAAHIFRELQFPDKGKIPELEINELRTRLGAEPLTTFIAEIEPYAWQIVEQVIR